MKKITLSLMLIFSIFCLMSCGITAPEPNEPWDDLGGGGSGEQTEESDITTGDVDEKEEIEKFREHHFIKRVVNRFFKENPSRSKYFSEYEISLYLAEFLFKKSFKTTDASLNRLIKKLEKRFVMI